MNKIYESDKMVVHDDREPITIDQAIDILWNGKSIIMEYPPDYSAENECDIFDSNPQIIFINDIGAPGTWEKMSKTDCFKKIEDYLRGHDLYR